MNDIKDLDLSQLRRKVIEVMDTMDKLRMRLGQIAFTYDQAFHINDDDIKRLTEASFQFVNARNRLVEIRNTIDRVLSS